MINCNNSVLRPYGQDSELDLPVYLEDRIRFDLVSGAERSNASANNDDSNLTSTVFTSCTWHTVSLKCK